MVNNLKGYIVNIFDFDQLQLSRQEWFVDPSMFNIKKRGWLIAFFNLDGIKL